MKVILHSLILLLISSSLFARVSILNGLTHVHKLQGGQQISGKLILKNESSKAARVLIYEQDLQAACGKQVGYFPINSHNRSMADWLKPAVDERTLAPNEEYTLFYTIDVPNASLENGSYWSVLMVEAADPLQEKQEQGMQINSVIRYAVQIIGEMGPMDYPPLSIENVAVNKMGDGNVLVVTIQNKGLFSIQAKVQLEVYNDKQEKMGDIKGTSKRIYPSNCNQFEINLAELKKGKYECILIVDNGRDLFGSTVDLSL